MKSAETSVPSKKPHKKPFGTVLLQLLFSIIVLGCGVALATYYLKTGPEAKPRKRQPSPPLVQITELNYGSHRIGVNGMGTVLAAKEINLTPGVGGEIIGLSDNMVPGGFFTKNETLVTIDPVDYQLAVVQLQTELAQAKNDLQLEMGNQRIARREFELLGQEVSAAEKKLMLRFPQLEMKKAIVEGIEARLAQAELNLKRTKIVAPFNGVVLSRSVNFGTRVSQSTVLARLVGTDEFWLKLAIPTDQLRWITFPKDNTKGSKVRIILQESANGNVIRTGRVIRLAADVEEQGRMATVYVAVDDPLNLLPENNQKPKLLLGSFVRADIEGKELTSVVPINRNHLREGNNIWLLKDDNTLEIRNVEIIARTKDIVLIGSGLLNGEKLIVSGLSAPVAGTPVKLLQEERDQSEQSQAANASVQSKTAEVDQ
ncbi:MAG: efflux RND transporter periplasmic adaptor subunit [Desulforhopalus sp.]